MPLQGGEKESLHVALDRHRDVVLWKLEGLDSGQMRQALVPSGTNLLGLVNTWAGRVSVVLPDVRARDRAAGGRPRWTFLAHDRWGGIWNREIKRLMLSRAFDDVPEVIFTIHTDNVRSQRAVERLGAEHMGTEPDCHGREQNRVYRLSRAVGVGPAPPAASPSWPAPGRGSTSLAVARTVVRTGGGRGGVDSAVGVSARGRE